jgi:hypothetical protein
MENNRLRSSQLSQAAKLQELFYRRDKTQERNNYTIIFAIFKLQNDLKEEQNY